MKRILLLLPILVLCSCNPDRNDHKFSNSANNESDLIIEQITIENYLRFLNVERINLGNAFQKNEALSFSGALSFATYDVTVTYSGVDWETEKDGTYKLKLNIGGYGQTIKINGSITLNDVVGSCTYKY